MLNYDYNELFLCMYLTQNSTNNTREYCLGATVNKILNLIKVTHIHNQ